MSHDQSSIAKRVCARWQALKSERSPWEGEWSEQGRYILPNKDQANTTLTGPNAVGNSLLFDTTAIYANQTYANGMLSYVTPKDSKWFEFTPPLSTAKNEKVKDWLQRCTEIAQAEVNKSNFYVEAHELYFDDGCYGTTVMMCLEGKRESLNFRSLPVASFALAENDEGYIDTLFRELKLTLRQIVQQFGEDDLSEKLKKALEVYKEKGTGGETKYTILHAIHPRDDAEREYGKKDGENKPIASVYVEEATKHVISNGGYDEQPFFASRHRKQSAQIYGSSPGSVALPDARQLNELVKNLDVICEVKANPRLLLPDTMKGEVDFAAGGFTYFDPNLPNALPKEWMTAGDYNIGLDREKRKQEAINRAFHVDLFQMFAQLDKQMTAREVAERSAEKLVQFTPAFSRKETELLTPLLRRVFGILYRGGHFPQPPDEIWVVEQSGHKWLPLPEIGYTSKIALAVKALANIAFARSMEMLAPLINLRPEILDNFNIDQITRDGARNDGIPSDWLLSTEERDQIRAARAQALAQQEQMNQALAMADAAGKAAKVTPDSTLGRAIDQAS